MARDRARHRPELGAPVADARRSTPVGARYSPNTSRSAPAHSPVVPPAWARAMVAGMTLSRSPRPHRRSSSRAPLTAAPCRGPPATPSTSARSSASTAGSTLRIDRWRRRPGSGVERRGLGRLGEAVDPDHLQLARLDAPDPLGLAADQPAPSARRWPRTRRPAPSTSSSSAHAASASSAVFASMTTEPSKMSSYSSRSVSKARICWMRSDHCWSQGRGRPRASFQAGSCMARARASRGQGDAERLEHDAGDVVLGLGLGEPERVDLDAVAEPAELGVGRRRSARRRSGPTGAVKARILQVSSTKRMPALTKNEIRPTTAGKSSVGRSGPSRARRRGRRWRWPGRRPPPGRAWPRPLGGGSCRR